MAEVLRTTANRRRGGPATAASRRETAKGTRLRGERPRGENVGPVNRGAGRQRGVDVEASEPVRGDAREVAVESERGVLDGVVAPRNELRAGGGEGAAPVLDEVDRPGPIRLAPLDGERKSVGLLHQDAAGIEVEVAVEGDGALNLDVRRAHQP